MLDMMAPSAGAGDEKPESTEKNYSTELHRLHRWFRAYETNKRREMDEQRSARQYYHDKQWTDTEIQRLKARGQQPTVRNRIKRKIDFLRGVEQRLRRDPKAYPRTPKHEKSADTATAALRYACDKSRWEKISSDCMSDGLIDGIGVIFVGIEGGEPKMRNVAVDRFFYDPRSMAPDFSDARYMGIHLWFDVDEAADRWPQHKARLESMVDGGNVQMTGANAEQDHGQQWGDLENRRVRVVEFWEQKSLRALGKGGFGWHFCYFVGELDLESGWSPYQGETGEPDCPYEAWSPYVDERGDRYGMIRTMKSVQDEINYSASKLLHRIASDRFFYEEGSIDDIDEVSRQLARPDGKIKIGRGEWGKTVGIVDQSLKIQGEGERFQMAAAEIENLGPNPGLVGKGEGVDGASGRALLAQRDSGMTELSPIFERHRDWKLRTYRKLWHRARQAWTAEKWINITDDSGSTEFVQLNQYQIDPATMQLQGQNVMSEIDVDIILNEGPDVITMNEELMQTLSNLGEAAMSPLGKVMIELSNPPNKERLLKMMDEVQQTPPEVAAMQQRMGQLEEMLAAINIDEKRAGIENKRADTLAKLVAVSTPAAPTQGKPDAFGNMPPPMQAPQPNLGMAFQAMQAFPLQYGAPLLEEQAQQIQAQPQGPPPGMEGQPPDMMPPGMPQPGQAPLPPPQFMDGGMDQQQMPEQMSQAGALPIDPGA